MSGIAKPLVKFANSKTPTAVVGVDYIVAIEKIDQPALPNQPAGSAQYGIMINYIFPNSNTKTAKIYWTTKAQRDTDFTAFETLVCTTV